MDDKKRGAWVVTRTDTPADGEAADQEKKPDEADEKEE